MSFENQYSRLDRALHRIAFVTTTSQKGIADLEERVFAADLGAIAVEKPVFVTALPRAGTTLLLELGVAAGGFASHTYRDMPFILVPMLWNRFSARWQKTDTMRERAHGDGMLVNADSAEAFDEVVWKAFWPSHYKRDRIVPWGGRHDSEFSEFLRNHVRKVVALRGARANAPMRYLSKNNLNIARIETLLRCFPDAIVIVPFREPLQHASSLLRQHRNFLEVHCHDAFARAYMAAIGHYEFGENLRLVDFDGWIDAARERDPNRLEFWVRYWAVAYRHLSRFVGTQVRFVSYEAFCNQPREGLARLAAAFEAADPETFLSLDRPITAARPYEVDLNSIPKKSIDEACALHDELCRSSIV